MIIKFNQNNLKALRYSSYGFYTAIPIFLGLTIGLFLDTIFQTRPILLLVFLFLGTVSSFYNLFIIVRKSVANDSKQP